MRILAFLLLSLTLTAWAQGQAQPELHLMPMPKSVQLGQGQLLVDRSFTVTLTGYGDARLQRAVDRFLSNLRAQTGMLPLDMKAAQSPHPTLAIQIDRGSRDLPELGEDESYALEVSVSGAKLTAPTSLGALRGLQTFLQLVVNSPTGFAAPAVSIQDEPRFAWRGLMIDSSRHFIPIDIVRRSLDAMEAVKLNIFHWHLSDNQGFRVESEKFPKLHELGSDGLYYTKKEISELVEYAADRGIQVIPEFDMPGHSTAWFVGYPEIASGHGPYQIERRWGVFDPAMNPTRDETYEFLDELIGEMAVLFPSHYFHIGGDEVNGKEWDANPAIQEFKRTHELKNNEALQAYFTARVQELVRKHGKTMMGWDEVLDAPIPKDIVIHVWRDQARLARAVTQGFQGVFSYGYYLDLMWPAAQHYAIDPLAADTKLGPEEQQRILGAEACMWTEFVSPEDIDARIWPRMAALAERFWSPQDTRDAASMYERLGYAGRWLEWRGLTHDSSYVPRLRRMAGSDDIAGLRTLADVVEPVKNYQREHLATVEPTSATPLNRLVDTAHPESVTGRQLTELVNAWISRKAAPDAEARIRSLLIAWRDQSLVGTPPSEPSFLVKELLPLSQELSSLGKAGLEALDYVNRRQRAPDAWLARQRVLLEEAKKPKAQVTLAIVPAIEKLVEASAAGHRP